MKPLSAQEIEAELAQFRQHYQQFNRQIMAQSARLDWCTPNSIVFESGSMRLRKFRGGDAAAIPLLMVYSHVNRPGIMDLHPDHSLIRCLLEFGRPVYLLDWGEVHEAHQENDLSVYVHDHLDAAVAYLLEKTGHDQVDLAGVCQGGTFALCYAALYPHRIHRLLPLVTPIDFHAPGSLIAQWTRYIDFSLLQDSPCNIPGPFITMLFQMMRPFDDMRRQVALIDQPGELRNPELMMKMDQWVYDCPDQPGRAFAQFMRWFYQDNALVNGQLELGGRKVKLEALTMPVLNVYASKDHLVPPASIAVLGKYVAPSIYSQLEFDGGHIGLLVSRKSKQTLLPKIGDWLTRPR